MCAGGAAAPAVPLPLQALTQRCMQRRHGLQFEDPPGAAHLASRRLWRLRLRPEDAPAIAACQEAWNGVSAGLFCCFACAAPSRSHSLQHSPIADALLRRTLQALAELREGAVAARQRVGFVGLASPALARHIRLCTSS